MIEITEWFFFIFLTVFRNPNEKHLLLVSIKQSDYDLEVSIGWHVPTSTITNINRERIIYLF